MRHDLNNQAVELVGVTNSVKSSTDCLDINNVMEFSGKAAGICYMPDDYLSSGINDSEKAVKRALGVVKRGHQSICDHHHVSMIVHTSKAMAMVLNSLGVYATSEKSARYTKMKPETALEQETYDKWVNKMHTLILKDEPTIDDSLLTKRVNMLWDNMIVRNGELYDRDSGELITLDDKTANKFNELKNAEDLTSFKLAQENARYMISVFTPTVMMYTVSFRQLQLIVDYLNKLHSDFKDSKITFYNRLSKEALDFARLLYKVCGGNKVISDIKNQHVRFLDTDSKKTMLGDSYTLNYDMSLAALAHEIRHRTIRHSMRFPEANSTTYFIPALVRKVGLEAEWLEDIRKLAHWVPQGTIVEVTEQGIFEDFALKCKERLCGRTMWETSKTIERNLLKFVGAEMCKSNTKLLVSMLDISDNEIKAKPRCRFADFKCTDGCMWGAKNALQRDI